MVVLSHNPEQRNPRGTTQKVLECKMCLLSLEGKKEGSCLMPYKAYPIENPNLEG